MEMKIVHTNAKNKDFILLCKLLDEYLNEIVGGADKREKFNHFNILDDIDDVIIIYQNENPIACGSFRKYIDDVAELKRIFVHKDYRGNGFSKILMNEIETIIFKNGYKKIILETGELLKESMNLYKSKGFKIIKNYPPYENIIESICMEKILINIKI